MYTPLLLPFIILIGAKFLHFTFWKESLPREIPTERRIIQKRLRLLGTAILTFGLVLAVLELKYGTVDAEYDRDIIGYEVCYGYSIPIRAKDSKRFMGR